MTICPRCGHDYGDPVHSDERDYIEIRGECIACAHEQLPEKDRPMYGEFFRAAMEEPGGRMRYYKITFNYDSVGKGGAIAGVVDMLNAYVKRRTDTLQEARRVRDAVKLLFGDGVDVEIRSRDDRVI